MQGLHFETIRAHQLPPPAILTNTQLSVALREAASAGRLNSLTSFRLTRMWDGLVPDVSVAVHKAHNSTQSRTLYVP